MPSATHPKKRLGARTGATLRPGAVLSGRRSPHLYSSQTVPSSAQFPPPGNAW